MLVDQRIERIVLPGLERTGRDHVGMAGEAQHRAFMATMGGPEVIHILDTHRLQVEAGIAQTLHHQFLAVGVDRCHRWAADQITGKLQGRRKLGVGRHEKLRMQGQGSLASQAPTVIGFGRGSVLDQGAESGGYLKAKWPTEAVGAGFIREAFRASVG